ncbi:uncharacterized protein [Amphiura filiformis]|uniref:uncharacterized protein isoform X2 n=1 Tax=Amphiura filiformis TaxID=82378 RepID=UPI003B20F40F
MKHGFVKVQVASQGEEELKHIQLKYARTCKNDKTEKKPEKDSGEDTSEVTKNRMAKAQQNYMKSSSLTEILTQFPRILSIGMIEQVFTIMYPEKTSKALARGVWCLFEILEHQRAWMDC